MMEITLEANGRAGLDPRPHGIQSLRLNFHVGPPPLVGPAAF